MAEDRYNKLMTKICNVMDVLERWAPRCLALDWDPVGLQLGTEHQTIKNIGITLDVCRRTVLWAQKHRLPFIISQHPLIFKHISSINYEHPRQAVLAEMLGIKAGVYTGHTAFDAATEGTNTQLARYLGLDEASLQPLLVSFLEPLMKVVTFVPHSHVDAVRGAMAKAGAGRLGNYSHCSFSTAGLGTFMPLKGAKPFIGSTGLLEKVEETRIEIVVPKLRLAPVLAAMRAAHPYEEVAYDVYPMEVVIKKWGVGAIGQPLGAAPTAALLRKRFPRAIWKGAPLGKRKIRRIAVLGGSGGSEVWQAMQAKADIYITGDITHHHDLLARDGNLPILDIGHTFAEALMLKALHKHVRAAFPKENVFLL